MVGARRAHRLHGFPRLLSLPALGADQSGWRRLSPDRGLLPVRRPEQGRLGLLVAAIFLAARPLARRGRAGASGDEAPRRSPRAVLARRSGLPWSPLSGERRHAGIFGRSRRDERAGLEHG